jgi:HEPN domain-containing protein
MADPSGQSPLPSDFSATLLDQVFRLWVEPEAVERGLGLTRADVLKALVVMAPSDVPKVYINDEVELIAQARAARSIEAGETVTLDDISSVEGLRPASVDGNAGWIALAKIGDEVIIAFDFRRNRQTSTLLVERASEFAEAAAGSLARGHLGPAIENGFAAAELAVKAQMFLFQDKPTEIHHERVTWWREWEKFGNAPRGTARVLQELYSERGASRYGDRPISMPRDDVGSALEAVGQIIDLARARSAEKEPPTG